MALELTLAYFTSILTFLLVFTLVYAVLSKTKILGENASLHAFISFIIAIIFILAPSARLYTLTVTPWVVVFLISLFFCLLLISFVHGNIEDVVKNSAVLTILVLVLLAIFLISGIHVFGPLIKGYFSQVGFSLSESRDVVANPNVLALILIFIIGAVLAWWFSKK
jgi:hypothetical protein